MRTTRKDHGITLLLLVSMLHINTLFAQVSVSKQRIVIDIAHGQKFYNDPALMQGKDPKLIERINYMTGELSKNAAALNGEIRFQQAEITPGVLTNCDLLFIHMPSSKFSEGELQAIKKYIQKGGSLFIVMEVDYWSTLAQVNVNDIVTPFGITFKADNPDTQSSGGYTKPSSVTDKKFTIPYHGARMVEGGTPFCFSNQTNDNPFGVYKEIPNGGKIIAMGDGMVSLYMTSWEGVNDYQCSAFMHDALGWLLK
jgi:hypothetical protein